MSGVRDASVRVAAVTAAVRAVKAAQRVDALARERVR
jgi:hypothetical protein